MCLFSFDYSFFFLIEIDLLDGLLILVYLKKLVAFYFAKDALV